MLLGIDVILVVHADVARLLLLKLQSKGIFKSLKKILQKLKRASVESVNCITDR